MKVAENWVPILLQAYEEMEEVPSAHLTQAIGILRSWDLQADIESVGATIFRAWRLVCWMHFPDPSRVGRDALVIQNTADLRQESLMALKIAADYLLLEFDRVDVPWGRIKRLERGDQQWPLGGGELHYLGMDTLRATAAKHQFQNNRFIAGWGQCTTTVALLGPRPVLRSITPYGQSSHPDSGHFSDQAPLYCAKQLREVPWGAKELVGRTESVRVYTLRPR